MCGDSHDKDTVQAMRNSLQADLFKMQESGVELFVDGKAALPDEIVSNCLREDCVYMPDYVLGEKGKLKQIRFDRVNLDS